MAQKQNSVSVIVPTYTGVDSIVACLESIASQAFSTVSFEVIVVVDGPNLELQQTVESMRPLFAEQKIPFTVHIHEQNRGRFMARKTGASLAKHEQLLFIDDRVRLMEGFMVAAESLGEKAIMPNVLEASQHNILSQLVYLLRRRIFGRDKWGENYPAYYLDVANFEKSPKGTTSLWVPRQAFLAACDQIEETTHGDTKHISDDTKLLRSMVDHGVAFYRPSDLRVYYQSRSSLSDEAHHIYQRGPKFVDYYLRRGSRFQPHLLTALLLLVVIITCIVLFGKPFWAGLLIVAALADAGIAVLLAVRFSDAITVFAALPLAAALFGLGIARGLINKLVSTHLGRESKHES